MAASVGWVEPFAKPITVQKVMGIASAFALRATADTSLHPSYALLVARRGRLSDYIDLLHFIT